MATVRLHLTDSLLLRFDATIVSAGSFQGAPSVILDRTAFYAEAGGQRPDRGALVLGGRPFPVRDVQIDEQGVVHHILESAPELTPGTQVEGLVDEPRRRDQMSQHTGQHMLSRAFFDVAGLETVSARLGTDTSTIDLGTPALGRDVVEAAERRVNAAVLEDRPIRILFPSAAELATLPLRKASKVERDVRLIDIEGFDLTPCGGTHCERTGQVGPVVVTAREKYKGLTRISFLAGQRALHHWQSMELLGRDAAVSLGCSPAEIPAAVARLREELRAQSQALGVLRAERARDRARRLLEAHPPAASGTTWIFADSEGEDIEALRTLAAALAERPDVVAVASSVVKPDRLVVARRGATARTDLGQWFKAVAAASGGRGGGRAENAEGKVPAAAEWPPAAPIS